MTDVVQTMIQSNILALPFCQITFQVANNEDWIDSIQYVVDDGTTNPPQIDLHGIDFYMQVRPAIDVPEVIIEGSTEDGRLQIGDYPNYGFLVFWFAAELMEARRAGTFIGDVVATDGEFIRRVISFNLNLVEGVTKTLVIPTQVLNFRAAQVTGNVVSADQVAARRTAIQQQRSVRVSTSGSAQRLITDRRQLLAARVR